MTQKWLFKTATEIIQSRYCITFVKENLLSLLRTNYWETAWKTASFHLITNMWWQHQTPQSNLNVPLKQLAGCFCRFCPLWVIPGRSVLIRRGMKWHCWRREVSKWKRKLGVCEVVAGGLRPGAVPGNGTCRVWESSAPKGGALAEHLLPC